MKKYKKPKILAEGKGDKLKRLNDHTKNSKIKEKKDRYIYIKKLIKKIEDYYYEKNN